MMCVPKHCKQVAILSCNIILINKVVEVNELEWN